MPSIARVLRGGNHSQGPMPMRVIAADATGRRRLPS